MPVITSSTWDVKYKDIAEQARPLFCIYAAPVSLCLAGYIQSVEPKSVTMVIVLMVSAGALYLLVLIQLPRFLALPFYPSYAAFTFPFVISAAAMKMSSVYLEKMGCIIGFLPVVVLLETVIAVCLVSYVSIRYMIYIFCK